MVVNAVEGTTEALISSHILRQADGSDTTYGEVSTEVIRSLKEVNIIYQELIAAGSVHEFKLEDLIPFDISSFVSTQRDIYRRPSVGRKRDSIRAFVSRIMADRRHVNFRHTQRIEVYMEEAHAGSVNI